MNHLKNVTYNIVYVSRLLYLFTASDFAPTVLPVATFGILGALSGPLLTTVQDTDHLNVLTRAPLVILFVWGIVLIFSISNQCSPAAVLEDRINKPWRPIPSDLITLQTSRRLLFALAPIVMALSWLLGVHVETAIAYTLSWMYNDRRGGDKSLVTRNGVVAALYSSGLTGALRVGCGPGGTLKPHAYSWVLIIAGVVFTTMHVSDFHDMEGDAAKSRSTVPLVFGERSARWSITIAVLFWSSIGILYWRPRASFGLVLISLGIIVAIRQLLFRGREEDRRTWLYWAWWTVCMYALPLTVP